MAQASRTHADAGALFCCSATQARRAAINEKMLNDGVLKESCHGLNLAFFFHLQQDCTPREIRLMIQFPSFLTYVIHCVMELRNNKRICGKRWLQLNKNCRFSQLQLHSRSVFLCTGADVRGTGTALVVAQVLQRTDRGHVHFYY